MIKKKLKRKYRQTREENTSTIRINLDVIRIPNTLSNGTEFWVYDREKESCVGKGSLISDALTDWVHKIRKVHLTDRYYELLLPTEDEEVTTEEAMP
jgi:hypothetical protein